MLTKIKLNGDKTINHANIKCKLGSANKYDHSVFYIEGSSFLVPGSDLENFNDVMKKVENSCRHTIKRRLIESSVLDTNFLMNFEICSDRMRVGKNSYLSFQYHFKQYAEPKSLLKIKDDNEDFFIALLNDLEDNLKKFNITMHKSKK